MWPNLDKSLPTPTIIYSESAGGGYYIPAWDDEEYIDGLYYDSSKGIIVLNPLHDESFNESALAHEYRHHWQWHHGVQFVPWTPNLDIDYDQHIRDYYQMPFELDALLYQTKVTNEYWSQYWLSLLNLYTPKVVYSIPTY